MDEGEQGNCSRQSGDAMMHGIKGRSHCWWRRRRRWYSSMDRRRCTSHRPLLGLTFNREERKRRKRGGARTFTDTQRDACWDAETC